jgi:hypothetical protein
MDEFIICAFVFLKALHFQLHESKEKKISTNFMDGFVISHLWFVSSNGALELSF